ncbi:MAG: HAD family hydrolase [Muribaculaceae bacterium]|jgi:phosphoglycolate phosphatase|nr:HAD family hydrolase [Muribaculaceae bacterium]
MKEFAIFDLDGTLLNTIDDLGHAANYALQTNGFPTHGIAVYPFFVGNGVRKLIERTLPEDNRDTETVEHLLKDFKTYYNEHNTDFTKPYAGIPELLHSLTDKGVRLAVASNKYQLATSKIVSHFFPDIDFVAVVGHNEGYPTKPDPSIVFEILGKAQVAKAKTVYIGDSGIDMETARRACIDSIGVTWGFRSEKELIKSYAVRIVHSPSEILDLIDNDRL